MGEEARDRGSHRVRADGSRPVSEVPEVGRARHRTDRLSNSRSGAGKEARAKAVNRGARPRG